MLILMKTALLALALASPAVAQTLTLLPSACGSTSYVNCINVPVAEGGSVWLHFPTSGSGFLQISAADGVTGTASGYGSYRPAASPEATHTLDIPILYFVDTDGVAHAGYGEIRYHYYLTRGSGRGGGGGGWKMMLDGGTINLQ